MEVAKADDVDVNFDGTVPDVCIVSNPVDGDLAYDINSGEFSSQTGAGQAASLEVDCTGAGTVTYTVSSNGANPEAIAADVVNVNGGAITTSTVDANTTSLSVDLAVRVADAAGATPVPGVYAYTVNVDVVAD